MNCACGIWAGVTHTAELSQQHSREELGDRRPEVYNPPSGKEKHAEGGDEVVQGVTQGDFSAGTSRPGPRSAAG